MSESASPWPLRSVALLIAILTWLFASYLPRVERLGESTLEVELEDVRLNYRALPPDYVYRSRPSEISMRVEGRSQRVQGLSAEAFSVTVPVPPDITPGAPTEVPLLPENAVIPEGVQLVSFNPSVLSVVIDRVEEIEVPVAATFEGEPGAGLTREDIRIRIRPETVTVRGPSSLLENVQVVATEPIDLSGRAINFREQRRVALPDPALTAQPLVVTVDVFLEDDVPDDDGR